ncbi:hypothetical protein TNCT_358511 [Trichonephila clavata]|uniref:Uncharacterized protein n=1 Tax=Trichonephila clavata TaxID=2740835 RepID=A0A8X6H8K1_TRICU|nr:hypothetical protein TNCT_358511 [Trichonephila clavata]
MFTIVYGKSARGIFPNLCGVEKDHLELTKEKLVEDPYRNSKPLKGKKFKGVRSARFGSFILDYWGLPRATVPYSNRRETKCVQLIMWNRNRRADGVSSQELSSGINRNST